MSESSTRRLSWSGVAIEAVVIVGSILLAFAIDAWWQERHERIQEQRVLTALRLDLTETLSSLERFLELHGEALGATIEFLWRVQLEGPVPQDDQLTDSEEIYRRFAVPVSEARRGARSWSVTVPDAVIGRAVNTPTFDPIMANINLLLSSGDLLLIRSPKLREALASLPTWMADARADEQIVEDFVFAELNPVLDRSGNLIRPNLFGRSWADLPSEALQGVSEVDASPLLANLLARKVHLEGHAVEQLRDVEAMLREMLEMIEAELL